MDISDKEAFKILDLPLGADKDAINQRYKTLTTKLAPSKISEDVKKLEKVIQAFHQLIPPNNKNRQNNLSIAGRSNHRANDDAANVSAMNALQRKAEKKKEKKKRKKEKRKTNEKSDKFISNNGKIEDSDCSSYEEESSENYNYSYGGGERSNFTHNSDTNGTTVKKPPPSFDGGTNGDDVHRNRQLQARSMAVQGNEAASHGLHQKAVKLFTQALSFDPKDHRFLGNRSFCFEQLKQYDKALTDADKAINLCADWPKGYFRRGKALIGLSRLSEAEESFSRVLQLDPECQEAQEEIVIVRRYRLMEMGFTQLQAMQAIQTYKQVQSALDALLSGEFHDASTIAYGSDSSEEDAECHTEARVIIPATAVAKKPPGGVEDIKMNPRNPHGLTSLWVGNVLPEVTEKELQKLFSKYGHVSSVRQLKEKFCAFVNFTDSTSAGRAMDKLQSHSVNGQRLLIKFPDNPITSTTIGSGSRRRIGGASSNNTSRNTSASSQSIENTSNGSLEDSKAKGPINGDECYFWRTTGCMFLETCRHKHLPKSKGVDRKPWQK